MFEQSVSTSAKLWLGGVCNTDGWKVNNIEIYLNAKCPGGYTIAIEWYWASWTREITVCVVC